MERLAFCTRASVLLVMPPLTRAARFVSLRFGLHLVGNSGPQGGPAGVGEGSPATAGFRRRRGVDVRQDFSDILWGTRGGALRRRRVFALVFLCCYVLPLLVFVYCSYGFSCFRQEGRQRGTWVGVRFCICDIQSIFLAVLCLGKRLKAIKPRSQKNTRV